MAVAGRGAGVVIPANGRVGLMPRVCTVCTHDQRAAIDQALVNGKGVRETSALFRVSEDAVSRHKEGHLPAVLAQGQAAAEVARADDLLDHLR